MIRITRRGFDAALMMGAMAILRPTQAAARCLGAWPELVQDVVAGNHGVMAGTLTQAHSIVAGEPPDLGDTAVGFDGKTAGVEITSLPLYQGMCDFLYGVYTQPKRVLPPGTSAVVACKDDGQGKPPGGWSLEDRARPDGSMWLAAYYRDETGTAQWIGSKDGVAERFSDQADLVFLRKIADEVSLWVNGSKVAALDCDVSQELNAAPLRKAMYRRGVGYWSGLMQASVLHAGTLRGYEIANRPRAASSTVLPPTLPKPPEKIDRRFANLGFVDHVLKLDGPAGTIYDCSGTTIQVSNTRRAWTPRHAWRLVGPQPDGCASGGAMIGTVTEAEPWNGTYPKDNNQSGFYIDDGRSDGFRVMGFRWHQTWDGGKVGWDKKRSAASHTVWQGCWGSIIRDDFVENDQAVPFSVIDCLADGCTNGVSASNNFAGVVVTVEDTIIWLEPYNIANQRQGPGLSWKKDGGGVKEFLKVSNVTLVLRNVVFATDRISNVPGGSLFAWALKHSTFREVSGRFYWLGHGPPPQYPSGLELPTDRAELEAIVADWKKRHPKIPRIPGVDE